MQRGIRWGRATIAGAIAAVLLVGACAGDDDVAEPPGATGATTTTDATARAGEPVADLAEELTGGEGAFIAAGEPYEPDRGYVEHEHVAAGTATAHVPVGELSEDGEWTLEPGERADFRTRVLIRRPTDPDYFSGVVLLEWLNVSGGLDANPDFTVLREEIVRQGHAWVGVSAQLIGVEGGPTLVGVDVAGAEVAGQGLKGIDPERYGTLEHPGDAFAFDIYTQVARAVRAGAPALGELEPEHVVAVGESQSAAALVTYLNGVQPREEAFDGFFVHSRGGAGLPIPEPGEHVDISGIVGSDPAIIRQDTDVPVLTLQAENDVVGVLNSSAARQPDTDTFRLWEVAGTAHADRHLVGDTVASALDCGLPINDAPFHVVAKAALRHLVNWIIEGDPPPEAPRLELTEDEPPQIRRDADGIAIGGVRTPPVDVAAEVLSGEPGPSADIICLLLGSTRPLPPERLAELHSSRKEYATRYEDAVDEAIEAGFVLEQDREALLGYARPELIPGG